MKHKQQAMFIMKYDIFQSHQLHMSNCTLDYLVYIKTDNIYKSSKYVFIYCLICLIILLFYNVFQFFDCGHAPVPPLVENIDPFSHFGSLFVDSFFSEQISNTLASVAKR